MSKCPLNMEFFSSIGNVESHLKSRGPFHDNKCPKCPERFQNRYDYKNHIEASNHDGYCCGLCSEVLDSKPLKRQHQNKVHGMFPGQVRSPNSKPKAQAICEECGKVYKSTYSLKLHIDIVHLPSRNLHCDKCDKVCSSEEQLRGHVNSTHNKTACTICGKLFINYRMKHHMNSVHTEDHLKPFSCQICHKGFAQQESLDRHMIIHSGKKPFACKYCGRAFADRGNMRMHQKTTHEGYKRPNKGGKVDGGGAFNM